MDVYESQNFVITTITFHIRKGLNVKKNLTSTLHIPIMEKIVYPRRVNFEKKSFPGPRQ